MNSQARPTTNAHHSTSHRHGHKPDISAQINHTASHNFALTKERDLDRYTPAISSKLNIYDQSRVVSPLNYFGVKFIRPIDKTQRFYPAGMDMVNSRKMSGLAFTKPVVKHFPQNL